MYCFIVECMYCIWMGIYCCIVVYVLYLDGSVLLYYRVYVLYMDGIYCCIVVYALYLEGSVLMYYSLCSVAGWECTAVL